jgi:hypothetical protein
MCSLFVVVICVIEFHSINEVCKINVLYSASFTSICINIDKYILFHVLIDFNTILHVFVK